MFVTGEIRGELGATEQLSGSGSLNAMRLKSTS